MPVALIGCLAAAGLSLLFPSAPGTDPWGWIVWGREVAHLDLHTAVGSTPAWKPLPVLFTTVFSLFGDAAPALWLVVARAGGLLALVLAYRLGARLGGRGAGAVAAVALVLSHHWVRQLAYGFSEPLVVALLLWAVERHLEGRRDQAFLLGVLVALSRPEAWPFLGAYAAFLWVREPSKRRLVAPPLVAVPILWFGADWWGAGDPFYAQGLAEGTNLYRGAGHPGLELLSDASGVLVAPALLGALAAVAFAARAGERTTLLLAGGALAWIGLLAVMTEAGYAGRLRFFALPMAIVCVLAGVGAARLVEMARAPALRLALAALLAALSVPFALPRVGDLRGQAAAAGAKAQEHEDLRVALRRAGGARRVLACGSPAFPLPARSLTNPYPERWLRGALAWQLKVPIGAIAELPLPPRRPRADGRRVSHQGGRGAPHRAVSPQPFRPPGVVFAPADEALPSMPRLRVRRLARTQDWEVVAVSDPERECA